MDKKAVIVLGMHRSGTSAVTAALEAIGVSLGSKSQLLDNDNEKGYFENKDIVPFNDRLLKYLNGRWDNPLFDGCSIIDNYGEEGLASWYKEADDIFQRNFADKAMWGLKDPRLCQLLPFWRKVFEKNGFVEHNTFYVHVLRNPLEVALSQKKRHNSNPDFHFIGEEPLQTIALWLSSHFQALREVNSDNNIVILFDDFLDDPNYQLQRLADFLGIDLEKYSTGVFVSTFLEKDLKHHYTVENKLGELKSVSPLIVSLYNSLKELSKRKNFGREEIRRLLSLLEPVTQAYSLFSPIYPLFSTAWYNWQEEKKEHERWKEKYISLRNDYHEIVNSVIWKLVSRMRSRLINIPEYFMKLFNKIIRYMKIRKEIKIIRVSGLFDEEYYLYNNPDVKKAGIDPIKHFVKYGAGEGRKPSGKFDPFIYISMNPDENLRKNNAFVHFIKYGREKGGYRGFFESEHPFTEEEIWEFTQYSSNENKEDLFTAIDIILPVYNGYEYIKNVIPAIMENSDINFNLYIVNDASTDANVKEYIKNVKSKYKNVTVMDNVENCGFAKSVNKGLQISKNHAVIINTDTLPPPNWLSRLMGPIITDPEIAATSPISNNGYLGSFPNMLIPNDRYEHIDSFSIDSVFSIMANLKIETPSCSGFCMGVNRNAINKIGAFDETYGRGYYEDTDWCQRANKTGFKCVIVTNLYIWHKNGGSFSDEERIALSSKNKILFDKKYPEYDVKLNEYRSQRKVKRYYDLAEFLLACNTSNGVIVLFSHTLGGGSSIYLKNLYRREKEKGRAIVHVSYKGNNSYTLMVSSSTTRDIPITVFKKDTLVHVLEKVKLIECIVSSLYTYPLSDVNDLFEKRLIPFFKKKNINLRVLIHEYYSICFSKNLINKEGKYCGIPDIETCNECLVDNSFMEMPPDISDLSVLKWRDSWESLFEFASFIDVFSRSSKDILLKVYPGIEDKINIKPHDMSYFPASKIIIKKPKSIHVAVLGGISYIKGLNVLIDIENEIKERKVPIKISVIGTTSAHLPKSISVYGKYDIEEVAFIIEKIKANFFFIPSICPETFCYAVSELMLLNVPVMCFDLGAQAEKVKKYPKGKVLPLELIDKPLMIIEEIQRFYMENYYSEATD